MYSIKEKKENKNKERKESFRPPKLKERKEPKERKYNIIKIEIIYYYLLFVWSKLSYYILTRVER